MALTKDTLEVNYEVIGEYKRIRVLMDTVIKEDGTEIARTSATKSFLLDADVSGESQPVQDLATMFWTDEVKAAYQAAVESI